jgi:hypothetical protein
MNGKLAAGNLFRLTGPTVLAPWNGQKSKYGFY